MRSLRTSVATMTAMFACVISTCVWAQDYPARPIRFLVGNAPGGGTDFVARAISPKLGEGLGKAVIVDNRAGATGAVAASLVAKASPDGYSILIITRSSHSISPALGGDKRAPGLENVPTFAEAGYPAVEAAQWYGLVTTAGTPKTSSTS